MLSRQAPIRVRELEWGAPAVATPATPEAEEEARPGRGRPRGRGRWRGRGRGRGTSANQPAPERRSMLDEDGDVAVPVHLPLSQTSLHTLPFSGNTAAYSPL